MNGDNEGRVPNRDVRPPHKTNAGGLSYLNIPTALEQIRGDEPIREVGEVVEEPSVWLEEESSNSEADEIEPAENKITAASARPAEALSAFKHRRRHEFN